MAHLNPFLPHDPADRGVVHAGIIGNLLHRVVAATIGACHGLISIVERGMLR